MSHTERPSERQILPSRWAVRCWPYAPDNMRLHSSMESNHGLKSAKSGNRRDDSRSRARACGARGAKAFLRAGVQALIGPSRNPRG